MPKVAKLNTKMSLAGTIQALTEQQKMRRFAIVAQSRCDRSTESLLARELGFDVNATEAERKAKFKEAAAVRKAIEKGSAAKVPKTITLGVKKLVLHSMKAREGWDDFRGEAEADMRRLARDLPVHQFADSTRGFGDLGLGIVIAETGDLDNYHSVACVWKRLGLAVINGEAQGRRSDKEAAALHGYSPKRRAEIWALFSDSMFRAQWQSRDSALRAAIGPDAEKLKDEALQALADERGVTAIAGPRGPYGEVYARRMAATADREMRPIHRHRDACRIMSKALLRDLWRAWRDMPPRGAAIEERAAA